jgi:hypothetical protein
MSSKSELNFLTCRVFHCQANLISKYIIEVLLIVIYYFKVRLSFSKQNLTLSHGRGFGARRSPGVGGSLGQFVT